MWHFGGNGWLKKQVNMKQNSLINSFRNALKGVTVAGNKERNFRIELFLLILIIVLGFIFSIGSSQWIMILLCGSMVLSLELMNTALKKLADAVTKEFHPLIKLSKDIASGAVLLASVTSIIIDLIIFVPPIKLLLC